MDECCSWHSSEECPMIVDKRGDGLSHLLLCTAAAKTALSSRVTWHNHAPTWFKMREFFEMVLKASRRPRLFERLFVKLSSIFAQMTRIRKSLTGDLIRCFLSRYGPHTRHTRLACREYTLARHVRYWQ